MEYTFPFVLWYRWKYSFWSTQCRAGEIHYLFLWCECALQFELNINILSVLQVLFFNQGRDYINWKCFCKSIIFYLPFWHIHSFIQKVAWKIPYKEACTVLTLPWVRLWQIYNQSGCCQLLLISSVLKSAISWAYELFQSIALEILVEMLCCERPKEGWMRSERRSERKSKNWFDEMKFAYIDYIVQLNRKHNWIVWNLLVLYCGSNFSLSSSRVQLTV